ncbi:VRR-NUC domain-containing protein [Desulfosporosinus youngiae]|uniref:VRR-NUC domain-containing protein n=1 Tax=Desulfosporosinus youngiae DSM 17734 TaxID=768710 RepID=H5XZW8_9FIRM|nr:VRR-NUC domain-containing protein [Desulfosporosinus youngiae]EHQ92164.1 VRR-NUC domain-containing protein [Desulfosporosinus youngiae DSM 17734]
MNHRESDEQQALFQWAKLMEVQYPELSLLHSIPNGGKRNAREAARLKKEGAKAGVSDIFLPVARGGFHGLYIEFKVKGGKLSDNQTWWLEETTKQGYYSTVCFGWIEASEVIQKYLARRKTDESTSGT